MARRRDTLRAYERVEWSKAELEGWLIEQAYEGMLRAMKQDRDRRLRAVQAKTAIAELGESVLRRISRVIGGGRFSRSSPFGYWYEDVRALGFLHPPLGLAYDQLFEWDASSCADHRPYGIGAGRQYFLAELARPVALVAELVLPRPQSSIRGDDPDVPSDGRGAAQRDGAE